MIHYVNELSTTDELRESMRGGGDSFPFSANEVDGKERWEYLWADAPDGAPIS